MKNMEPLHFRI